MLFYVLLLVFIFFFFQAEDGIRDVAVTGVQTCALPIFDGLRCTRSSGPRFGAHLELFAAGRVVLVAPGIGIAPPRVREGAYVRGGSRSEERRVGKECRSRWAPDH